MEPESLQSKSFTETAEAEFTGRARVQVSGFVRFAWVFAGVVMPIICFGVGRSFFGIGAHSLSGRAGLLLSLAGSLPLVPLLLICMGSITTLALRPGYVRNGWVQLGIFSGVILSLEYWAVFQVALSRADGTSPWPVAVYGCVWGAIWSVLAVAIAWFGGRILVNTASVNPSVAGASAILLTVLVLIVILTLPYSVIILVALCLLCSTPWAVAAYLSAAIWLVRRRKRAFLQYTLWQLLVATTWLAVHFAAWRSAILLVLDQDADRPQ